MILVGHDQLFLKRVMGAALSYFLVLVISGVHRLFSGSQFHFPSLITPLSYVISLFTGLFLSYFAQHDDAVLWSIPQINWTVLVSLHVPFARGHWWVSGSTTLKLSDIRRRPLFVVSITPVFTPNSVLFAKHWNLQVPRFGSVFLSELFIGTTAFILLIFRILVSCQSYYSKKVCSKSVLFLAGGKRISGIS